MAGEQGQRNADGDADRGDAHCLAQNHSKDLSAPRPECHADTDCGG
jgi:hypothetical protein